MRAVTTLLVYFTRPSFNYKKTVQKVGAEVTPIITMTTVF
jgi:hypothetical protein